MTETPKPVGTSWYVIDVANKTLGRVATQVANHLRGKNNPHFSPHRLPGSKIIVINADKVYVTGKKVYHHYTGYPGGLKSESFESLFARFPARIFEKAVRGMLPKNALGRAAFKCLRVYAGAVHPHTAQHPEILELH